MTAIDDKHAALGGSGGFLGAPTSAETTCPDGVGRFRHYNGGSIYWTPSTGAWEVHGDIRGLWASLGWETSPLGYPISDERNTPHGTGRVSDFQRGSIYWDGVRGAYEVFPRPAYPPSDPAVKGGWQIPSYSSGVVGMHAALLHNNKVLFFAYREPTDHHNPGPIPPDVGESATLDLATRTISTPSYAGPSGATMPNIFCSGHALMPDGRLLVAGGDREAQPRIRALHVYTPGSGAGAWRHVGQTAEGRWYATCATLPDGRVVIVGGEKRIAAPATYNTTFELFDGRTETISAPINQPAMSGVGPWISYPFVYVLPQGKLLVHGGTRTTFYNLPSLAHDGTAIEAAARPDRDGRTYGLEGTSPLLPGSTPAYRARVMMIGGGRTGGIRTPATASCEILDTNATTPAWALAAPLHHARVMPDAVLLPDGKVLVMNGSSRGHADNGANPVWEAEMYDPQANTWTDMAPMSVPRLYHATALLLPDGRVMTAGTDSVWNPDPFHTAETRVEIFSPPYLSRGPRPTISAAPATVLYGSQFAIGTPEAAAVTTVALMRCGTSTHSFNPDQRHVGLRIVSRSSASITVEAPPNGNVAPPGQYMLFILRDGVPSVARFVKVKALAPEDVRAPQRAPVHAVSRAADKLDIFVTDRDGAIKTSRWEPAFTDWWRGFSHIRGGRTGPGAPVTCVSRAPEKLDAFVAGTDGRIYTAAWEPIFSDGWRGWWPIRDAVATAGAHVGCVSRSRDKLDLFVVGTDGRARTAFWNPTSSGWQGWSAIGTRTFPQRAPIHAVSRSADKMDIFATDSSGKIVSAAWEPAFTDGFHGWFEILGGVAAPGAPVTCVARSADKLDLFVTGTDGRAYTAAWDAAVAGGWRGWWPIGTRQFPAGAPIHVVSRSPDKMDIFATDTSGRIVTAAWEPAFTDGFHGWWELRGGLAAPGAPVTCVSRSRDKLDVFVTGTDDRVWTAAWDAAVAGGWRGWWPIRD
jgi:hypothetical protein